jgi:FkbM family methyltransferase
MDYGTGAGLLFVDIGANIGLASLYFLTRNPRSKVISYEPNPVNTQRLRETLKGLEARYELREVAMSLRAGTARFYVEDSGRYGKIDPRGQLEVEAVGIDHELRAIVAREGEIDVVKIDTEGTEPDLVAALPRDGTVRQVYWETNTIEGVRHEMLGS